MGGYGTVIGTVLGVLFINMMKNNLVLLGVSSSWQRAAVGVLLVIGITIQAIGENRKSKRERLAADKDKE
jgi:simple sugar transport system permease protein